MGMNVLDFSTTNTEVLDEILNVPDANPVNLLHDIFYNKTGKLVQIWTAAGKSGTQLTEGVDYDIGSIFPDGSLPTSISPDVAYTTVAITNATYQSTNLYVSYFPISDIINARRFNPLAVVQTSAFTITTEDVIEVDTSGGNVTITLPEITSIFENVTITVRKIAAANTVTINRAGTDTITRAGLTSVTLTSDGDYWTFFAGSTRWELIAGYEYFTGTNTGIKYHDGIMIQEGSINGTGTLVANVYGTTSGNIYQYTQAVTYVNSYVSTPTVLAASSVGVNGLTITISTTQTTVRGHRSDGSAITVLWLAKGRWYA